ncbi:hypothetical protein GLAREA_09131 [Glarea lozoyensis ATCC 20868]|uniref:Uncharacterized protein n=1 Tax=Glarea lozoyensis (strain ATCC 20868 / MF5171) TaxID=1116229 RepID=S3EFK4_GLAL2|nr:uncharacterized protein GLAREA_09131 [Glarea lozoyensis ATCC 20868]EPE36968.1 hypothetical protein GLAREA_09131 [Glarea lozoyensis ATCC 20868]
MTFVTFDELTIPWHFLSVEAQKMGWRKAILGQYFASPDEKPRKKRWLQPEKSTGDLYRSVNLGGKSCWEAIGPVRRTFEALAPKIKSYLDEKSDPVEAPVTWTIYLIGYTRESSRPTVMFCSPSKIARSAVKKIVDDSDLLDKYPGVETGSCSREFQHLADGDEDYPHVSSANQGAKEDPTSKTDYKVFYNPSEVGPGMRIRIRHYSSNGSFTSRDARCGGILKHNEIFYAFTVAHVFESDQNVEEPLSDLSDSEAFEFELDQHSDSESEDEMAEITSRGSTTPDMKSHDAEARSISSAESTTSILEISETAQLMKEIGHKDGTSAISEPIFQALSTSQKKDDVYSQYLGTATIFGRNQLDFSLIHIDPSQIEIFGNFYLRSWPKPALDYVSIRNDTEVLILNQSQTPLRGKLCRTPTFMILPGSSISQQVLTVRSQTPLILGDCGSWVIDPVHGAIYGHVVAGSGSSQIAYAIPFRMVLSELRERFEYEWYISEPRQHQPPLSYLTEQTGVEKSMLLSERANRFSDGNPQFQASSTSNNIPVGLDMNSSSIPSSNIVQRSKLSVFNPWLVEKYRTLAVLILMWTTFAFLMFLSVFFPINHSGPITKEAYTHLVSTVLVLSFVKVWNFINPLQVSIYPDGRDFLSPLRGRTIFGIAPIDYIERKWADSLHESKSENVEKSTSDGIERKENDALVMDAETKKELKKETAPFWGNCLYWYTVGSIFGLAVTFFLIVGMISGVEVEACLMLLTSICLFSLNAAPRKTQAWCAIEKGVKQGLEASG